MTKQSGFKLRVRSRMAKTGESYAAARSHLDTHARPDRLWPVLHVTNGDSAASSLRLSGVDGRVLAWRDTLHEGPVPGVLTPAALRRVRAQYLARRVQVDGAKLERELAERDQALEAGVRGLFMLWFEADLYDQLQLLQVLDALARLEVEPARIGLVCIGEHKGIAHFGGLGELKPEQLGRLSAEAVVLGAPALDLAVDGWRAFTASEPDGIRALSRARSPELRFVGEAFGRLMQEYPSRLDGLSLTQRRILMAADEGPTTAGELFRRVCEAERRPFLGDVLCFAYIRELAGAPHPLLETDERGMPFRDLRVKLTPTGERVLAGDHDHVHLNGLDRWIGGVHLTDGAPAWRYDDRLERLHAVG